MRTTEVENEGRLDTAPAFGVHKNSRKRTTVDTLQELSASKAPRLRGQTVRSESVRSRQASEVGATRVRRAAWAWRALPGVLLCQLAHRETFRLQRRGRADDDPTDASQRYSPS